MMIGYGVLIASVPIKGGTEFSKWTIKIIALLPIIPMCWKLNNIHKLIVKK